MQSNSRINEIVIGLTAHKPISERAAESAFREFHHFNFADEAKWQMEKVSVRRLKAIQFDCREANAKATNATRKLFTFLFGAASRASVMR